MRNIIDKDSWQEIFATIKKNKLRTFLTALGVFWGIFMLVFLLGLGNGLETGVFRNFGSGAKNIMYIWARNTMMPYKGMPAGRRVIFELDDALAIKAKVNGVKDVSPRVFLGNKRVNYKNKDGEYPVRGEYPSAIDVEALVVKSGRFINDRDIADSRKVVCIGQTVKEEMFGEEEAVGQRIRISNVDFLVVGVFAPIDIKEWTQEDMESIGMPLTTCYKAFGIRNQYVDNIVVSAYDEYKMSVLEPNVRSLLKARHSVHPDDQGGVGGWNMEEEFSSVQNLFFGIKSFLWFVGIGTLIAGIVGVSNIMLITVKERTKEIGIRKALGANPNSIIGMIITESIFITALAGYVGMLIGTILIAVINFLMKTFNIENQNFYDPKVDLSIAISALVILILAGAVAGLIPALIAAKVNPVTALKDE